MNLTKKFKLLPIASAVMISALTSSFSSFAADVDQSMDWSADGELKVNITSGQIKIRGWNKNEVKLTGDFNGDSDRLVFKKSGKNVKLEIKDQSSGWWGGNSGGYVDFGLHAPKQSDLEIDGTSLSIEIQNIIGDLDISSISGSIKARGGDKSNQSARTDIETVSGDIDIEDAAGKLRLRTVSGDISADVSASTFEAKSVSGDIEGQIGQTDYASFLSVSGDIEIELSLSNDSRIEGQTVSGNLDLDFKERVSADFEVNTGPGGDIRNRLSDDRPDDDNRWGQELSFTLKDGDSTVELETMSGTIKLN